MLAGGNGSYLCCALAGPNVIPEEEGIETCTNRTAPFATSAATSPGRTSSLTKKGIETR